MKNNKIKIRNVVKIGVACLVLSMLVACGDKCKDVNSNFDVEYAKYNELRKQFNEYLTQCMQIEGFEDAYRSIMITGASSWGVDLSIANYVYARWREDIDIWTNLTDTQQKLITDMYDIACKTYRQGNICTLMVIDNPDCLGDKEEFTMDVEHPL